MSKPSHPATRQCYICKGTGKVTKSAGFAGSRQYNCSKCSGTGILERTTPAGMAGLSEPAAAIMLEGEAVPSRPTASAAPLGPQDSAPAQSPISTAQSLTTNHQSLITNLSLPAPDPALDLAGRVAWYHALSREAGQISIMAACAAGVELLRAKAASEGMFLGWVKRNCEFSQATAYRYMSLAESLLAERLPPLLAAAEPLTIEAVAQEIPADAPIEAKTLTQLYFDFGICAPPAAGGKRAGAGRPRSDANLSAEEIEARAREDAAEAAGDVAALLDLIISQQMWHGLGPRETRNFARLVQDKIRIIAAAAEQI